MAFPPSPYIEERNGRRLDRDRLLGRRLAGEDQSYSTLKLSQVYGVIAYYLEHETSHERLPGPTAKKVTLNRSAVTGKFVTPQYTKNHPRTTETEQGPVKSPKK